MSKDPIMEPQSDSAQSESHKIQRINFKQYLDEEKIQKFQQDLERLKKFVDETQSLSFIQNDELCKYIAKFQKPQNQRKNDVIFDQKIIELAQQRIERMIKSQKPRKNWTLDDRAILEWVVVKHALLRNYKNIEKEFTKEDWKFIGSLIPGANTNSCMFKWLSLHKTNLNEACWSQEESSLLKTLVAKYVDANKSIRWKDVCKKLYLENQNAGKNYRTQKQCKEHWVCKLNPNIKRQPWTQEEDILLLQTIKQNSGLKKWVEMVKLFQGRTQNAVKNRYNLIIEKERKCIQKQKDELDLIENYLQRCYVQKFTKILQPDSQEKNPQQEKKTKKKTAKTKKSKKSQSQLLFNLQFAQINARRTIPRVDTESTSFDKIEKISLVDTSDQQPHENLKPMEDLFSIENLSDIARYNHRANDIQYDFMRADSSLLH